MALIKSRKLSDPAIKLAGDPTPDMLVSVTDPETGKTRVTELQNAVKYSGISLSSGIIGQADKDTVPDDSTNKFLKYSIPNDEDHVGLYPNFLDLAGDPLEIIDDDPDNDIVGDLSQGVVEFWGQNGVWKKNITKIPLKGFASKEDLAPLEDFRIRSQHLFKNVPTSSQLFNKNDATKILSGKKYNISTNEIDDVASFSILLIPVKPGKIYSFSGFEGTSTNHQFDGGGLFNEDYEPIVPGDAISKLIYSVSSNNENGRTTYPIPSGTYPVGDENGKQIKFVAVNVVTIRGGIDAFMFVEGSLTMDYESYTDELDFDAEAAGFATDAELAEKLSADEVLETSSVNLIDPSLLIFDRRYSTGSKTVIAADSNLIGMTNWIKVEVGKTYVFFGSGVRGLPTIANVQGGYFNNSGETAAQANISFAAPVIGEGAIFLAEYPYVVLSVLKTENNDFGDYIVELADGEIAPDYTPYELVRQIKPELIPNSGGGSGVSTILDSHAWNTFIEGFSASDVLKEKCPEFYEKCINKEVDVHVVSTGTSEWGRSLEMCTAHPKASERPPLMHSNNAASYVWDAIKWDNQFYRSYAFAGFFTEVQGSWNTLSGDPLWFDTLYRDGKTRVATDDSLLGDMLKVPVPAGSNAFRYIFRTDSSGCEQIKIGIDLGPGALYVCEDIDGEYVEAVDYVFSIKEATPVAREITAPNEKTGANDVLNIATKANSRYQKRLYFRSKIGPIDSTSLDKVITFSKLTTGRFMYWGVEWSPRAVMITYINAALGSYNTVARNERGLPRTADTDVYPNNPDLLFCENPIHNDGASVPSTQQSRATLIAATNNYFFNPDYELSLTTRSMALNGRVPEMIIFNAGVMQSFHSINEETGDLVLGIDRDGDLVTALDQWNAVHKWLCDEHPEVVSLNCCAVWVKICMAVFGSLWLATVASGASGSSFSKDTAHHNDLGSKVWAKMLIWIFNFLR